MFTFLMHFSNSAGQHFSFLRHKAAKGRNLRLIVFALAILLGLTSTGTINGEYSETAFVAFRPDGQQIAVANPDGGVSILDSNTLVTLNSFEAGFIETEPIWSPDGLMLGFGNGAALEIWESAWDPNAAKLIIALEPEKQSGRILAASWSPDGALIVATAGNRLSFWNVTDFSEYEGFYGSSARIRDIAWNVSNNAITVSDTSGYFNTLTIDNPDNQFGIILEDFIDSAGYHVSPSATAVAWSPNDEFLAFGGEDSVVRIVHSSALKPEPILVSQLRGVVTIRLTNNVSDISWSPDGSYIAVGDKAGGVGIWDAATGALLNQINLGEDFIIHSVDWSPDGSQLAYGTTTGSSGRSSSSSASSTSSS
jgi:WD40 repeat protein